MDDIDYKVKKIYYRRIMALLCLVGISLTTTHNAIHHYYWSLQDNPPSTRSAAGFSVSNFIIFLILIYTLHMLSNQNHEFIFEACIYIIGATVSLSLTTIEGRFVTKTIVDEILRNKYELALSIWVVTSYIFLLIYWIGMRKFLMEPLRAESSLEAVIVIGSFFLPVFIIVLYAIAFKNH